MPQAKATTRRYQSRASEGDRRRDELLGALGRLLQSRSLADIGIADIAAAAGVSRPTFYFYFPNKATAAGALIGDLYRGIFEIAEWFDAREGDPRAQLRTGIRRAAATWRARPALMVAMLDAVSGDPDVRRTWNGWIEEFERRATGRLVADQSAGVARPGIVPEATARILVGATFAAMEREVRDLVAGIAPGNDQITALIEIWQRSAYPSD